MTQFMKTSILASEYEDVKKIGDVYIVHLDKKNVEDNMIECYECCVTEEPNIQVLNEELTEWKTYMSAKELAKAKMLKIDEVTAYDSSDAVNSFDIVMGGQTITTWITPDKRADYALSIESAKKLQMTEVTPVFNGVPVTISIELADLALAQIQIYANRCYNVTEQHKAAINALTSVSAVEAYDYTAGYPSKLIFNLDAE